MKMKETKMEGINLKINLNTVLLVYKKSLYELWKNSPDEYLRSLVTGNCEDAVRLRMGHDNQNKCLDAVMAVLDHKGIPYDRTYRAELSEITDRDLVISVGGDGTLLEVSHYIRNSTLILGVNSDPEILGGQSRGINCGANIQNFEQVLESLMQSGEHLQEHLHEQTQKQN